MYTHCRNITIVYLNTVDITIIVYADSQVKYDNLRIVVARITEKEFLVIIPRRL